MFIDVRKSVGGCVGAGYVHVYVVVRACECVCVCTSACTCAWVDGDLCAVCLWVSVHVSVYVV